MRYISTQKWIWMKYLVIEWFGTCQSKINRYASGEGGFRKTCKRSEGIIQRNCGSGVIFQNVYLGKLCPSRLVKGRRKCFITQNVISIYSTIKKIFPLDLHFATDCSEILTRPPLRPLSRHPSEQVAVARSTKVAVAKTTKMAVRRSTGVAQL